MKTNILMVIIFFMITSNILLAAEINNYQTIEADGSILLPSQKSTNLNITAQPIELKQKWDTFYKTNPTWKIFFNEVTGKPHRAFGKPIQIEGFSSIDKENVLSAAYAFIEQKKDLFGIDISDLKLRKSLEINNLWTLSFAQLYQNLEVLLTEVELRIRKDGKVMAFGINFYDDIDIEIIPSINQNQAETVAKGGLQIDDKKVRVQSNSPLYILPIKNGKSVSFGLVKEIIVDMPSTNQTFASYVDMHYGNILWRRSLVANVETPVTVTGGVKLDSRFSPVTEVNFADLTFSIDGAGNTTDLNGNAIVDINQPATITSRMEGSWAKIIYDSQTNANFLGTIHPGEPFTLQWTDINSHRFERNLFYHANFAHDFYKMMDPESEAMDFQLNVTIYNTGQPNAGSELEQGNIYFIGAAGTSLYVVETPSVLYHEYGHSINTRLYKELGISQGMISMACHEAMADLNASLMTDQPKIGYLAFPDTNQSIRNLVNTRKYPRDINEESHNDGMILGGAYWDLRKITNLDYVRWLVHYTKKMGTPDDENTGLAFFEWFIETLITDDSYGEGDNDMSNGSPYSNEIIESFNNHDIGTKLAMLLSFEHTPYGDTQDTENPYKIQFKLRNPITFLNYEPQDVKLNYSNDGLKTKIELGAAFIGNDTYEAYIPAMPKGTIIKYYMSATDQQSGQNLNFSSDEMDFKPFEFLVGYQVGYTEDFENTQVWTIGDSGDGATGGRWEIGVPQIVALNSGNGSVILQPGSDHSEPGTKCLVTGASNGGGSQQGILSNMPDGKTSVISPIFDLTTTLNPIFSYYRFFSNFAYLGINPSTFRTLASSNSGMNWIEVELTSTPADDWERVYFPIESFVTKTNSFRVKFEFTAYRYAGIPMYLSEGLVDDVVILTANNDANITEVNAQLSMVDGQFLTVYPNPFTDYVNISLNNYIDLSEIKVFDMLGNEVKSLKQTFSHNYRWDRRDNKGNIVPDGLYFVKISDGTKTHTEKIIIK
ncbi:MAG: T9SS type A sorting domain-containing protein [bacterium]